MACRSSSISGVGIVKSMVIIGCVVVGAIAGAEVSVGACWGEPSALCSIFGGMSGVAFRIVSSGAGCVDVVAGAVGGEPSVVGLDSTCIGVALDGNCGSWSPKPKPGDGSCVALWSLRWLCLSHDGSDSVGRRAFLSAEFVDVSGL